MKLADRATEWMTIDLRALGAFRIALAFSILVDLLDRARAFTLYTEEGPLPLGLAIDGAVLTFHRGPPALVAALFVVHAMIAVAFGVGVRTRVVGIVLFAFQLSLQQRCYTAGFLGDELLRALLFWACVLPVGERFSFDSKNSRAPEALRSFAAGGLVLVPVAIFFFTAIEKLVSPHWRDGRALSSFVDTWIFPTTLGVALFDAAPALFPPFTYAAIVAEIVLPLMLFLPWWRARLLAATGLFALMFGIALLLDAGLFPLITATALVPLIPRQAWSRDAREVPVRRPRHRALDRLAFAGALTMLVTSGVNIVGVELPQPFSGALKVIGLNQHWPMFVHPESVPRGWLLVAARMPDGTQWDVLRDAPLDAAAVPPVMSTMLTFRERRVLQRAYVGGDGYKEITAAWLCRLPAMRAGPPVSISVGYADVRGEPPSVLVIEIVKDQACTAR